MYSTHNQTGLLTASKKTEMRLRGIYKVINMHNVDTIAVDGDQGQCRESNKAVSPWLKTRVSK